MNLGLIQGRLSLPLEGFQDTPVNWKREFLLLPDVGLQHIEWVITKESFSSNPFFSEDLREFSIYSVCADNLVDNRISDESYVLSSLTPICEAAVRNKVKFVTIPLLEDSDVSDDTTRNKFKKLLQHFTKKYPQLNFSLEAELGREKLQELLIADNVCVTYDTGNMTSCGFDHELYIKSLSGKISNVHLKDRTRGGKSVTPSTGDTDFRLIFKTLRETGYPNVYTLQTSREKEGEEISTITKHAELLRSIYDKSI
jgi:L-ribulose-5-phosphate 3-epimerase